VYYFSLLDGIRGGVTLLPPCIYLKSGGEGDGGGLADIVGWWNFELYLENQL
jgi:hypothetical protein